MTLRRLSFTTACLALTGLLSIGCTGVLEPGGNGGPPGPGPDAGPPPGDGGGQPPGGSPQALFNTTVRGLLKDKCAGCHVVDGAYEPYFLQPTVDDYHAFITADYPNGWVGYTAAESSIYEKGQSPHSAINVQWDAAESDTIKAWIDAEYEYAQGGGGGGGGGDAVTDGDAALCQGDLAKCALENFAKCFTYANWSTYKVGDIANVQSNAGVCSNCHSEGGSGFYSNPNSSLTYTNWKSDEYIDALVKTVVDGEGTFVGLAPSYSIELKGANPGNHPPYNIELAGYKTGLDAFVDATLTSFGAGGCIDDPGQ